MYIFPFHANALPTLPKTRLSVIKQARIAEWEPIVSTLTLAFNNDPAMRWMYSNPHQYLSYFPQFIAAFAGKAFEQGTAFYSDGYSGAALWFAPGVEPDTDAVVKLIQQTVAETERANLFSVFEQMGHYHPHESHWYLPLIGVEPTQQGKGYGSALMQHILEQCDRDRLPAYLESSKPVNIPFYQRHGFEVMGTIQIETSPTIFPMIRQPQ